MRQTKTPTGLIDLLNKEVVDNVFNIADTYHKDIYTAFYDFDNIYCNLRQGHKEDDYNILHMQQYKTEAYAILELQYKLERRERDRNNINYVLKNNNIDMIIETY